jgi:hypothetical protein
MRANGTRDELLRRLVLCLVPESGGWGLERSIGEQLLADAIDAYPPPRTLRDLLAVLDRDVHHRGTMGMEVLESLRRRARELPDLPLQDLAP